MTRGAERRADDAARPSDDRPLPLPTARLLIRARAAAYLGLGATALLPVKPKRVRPGKRGLRYDIRDLDRWIDSLEIGEVGETDEELLDRLSR